MDPKCEYLKISNICWGSNSNKSYSKMRKIRGFMELHVEEIIPIEYLDLGVGSGLSLGVCAWDLCGAAISGIAGIASSRKFLFVVDLL
jgi:hypothetical protein